MQKFIWLAYRNSQWIVQGLELTSGRRQVLLLLQARKKKKTKLGD